VRDELWIDTEFNEYRGALISLALVAEDGREWYGVRFCDDPGWWVGEHVMPHLGKEPQRDADLRSSLGAFLCEFDSVHIVSDWPGDSALTSSEYRAWAGRGAGAAGRPDQQADRAQPRNA
jgi:hypothetical protein